MLPLGKVRPLSTTMLACTPVSSLGRTMLFDIVAGVLPVDVEQVELIKFVGAGGVGAGRAVRRAATSGCASRHK
jgi:hypothetical protein